MDSGTVRSSPLSQTLGIELTNFDVSKCTSADEVMHLVQLLYRHGVVCLRDQNLDPEALSRISQLFGNQIHHNEENLRLDGLPGVMSLSNADDRDERQLNGGAHWHTDLIHSAEPASFTMLYAVAVPKVGGGTLFADQVAAYRALSKAQQEQAKELVLMHTYEGRTDGSVPVLEHALVRRHPATGVEALYGAADTGIGVVGLTDEEARPLLDQIGRHGTRPEFIYHHKYRLHDLVIWDNARLLHRGERLDRARRREDERIMHRVSVRGWPQLHD